MNMYKAFHWPTQTDFYFTKHPSPSLLARTLKEDGVDEDYEDTDWEVGKISVIDNK